MMSAADDTATDRALRGLDAAAPELDDDQRRRADATLSRILATDPGVPAPLSGTAPQRRHRRVLLAGGLVAAAATVAVVVPVVVGGDGAFASWSPTPTELTGAARRAAVDACLVLQGDEEGPLAFDPGADAAVLVAESRGGWSYVLYRVESASGGELEGSCLVPESLVDDPRPAGGGFFGSLGGADEGGGPAPARNEIREVSSGAGSVDSEAFVFAEGRAGADVAGIVVTTPGGREVEASVENGRWAVWWPAGEASMANPELTGAPTYEVILRTSPPVEPSPVPG